MATSLSEAASNPERRGSWMRCIGAQRPHIPKPLPPYSRVDYVRDLFILASEGAVCSIVGVGLCCVNLFIKTITLSYADKFDRAFFGQAKLTLKASGGMISNVFKNVLGIIHPPSGQFFITPLIGENEEKLNKEPLNNNIVFLVDSGDKGFLSAPLIGLYESYMKRVYEVKREYEKSQIQRTLDMTAGFVPGIGIKAARQAAKDCTRLQKIVSQLEYVATYAVAPRLAAVAMLVAVTVTRVLDLGIGCVFAPFALLLAPLELDEFNEITFKALQGLMLVHDYFLLLHNFLSPVESDEYYHQMMTTWDVPRREDRV